MTNTHLKIRDKIMHLELDEDQITQAAMLDAFNHGQCYEPATSAFLAHVLKEGDTFVDVGAHVGYFSCLAGVLVAPSGRVYSFEPDAYNFLALRKNRSLNGVNATDTNSIEVMAPVGDRDQEFEVYVNKDNDGGHSLWNPGIHPFNVRSAKEVCTHTMRMVRLDQFKFPDTVRLMKIDTEGCELATLVGCGDMLKNGVFRNVILEINTFALEQMRGSEMAIRRLMREAGYSTYLLESWPPIKMRDDQEYPSPNVYNLLFSLDEVPHA